MQNIFFYENVPGHGKILPVTHESSLKIPSYGLKESVAASFFEAGCFQL